MNWVTTSQNQTASELRVNDVLTIFLVNDVLNVVSYYLASYPAAAGIYQKVTCLLASKRLPSLRQPDVKTEVALVLLRP
jgi:hypothetical protein